MKNIRKMIIFFILLTMSTGIFLSSNLYFNKLNGNDGFVTQNINETNSKVLEGPELTISDEWYNSDDNIVIPFTYHNDLPVFYLPISGVASIDGGVEKVLDIKLTNDVSVTENPTEYSNGVVTMNNLHPYEHFEDLSIKIDFIALEHDFEGGGNVPVNDGEVFSVVSNSISCWTLPTQQASASEGVISTDSKSIVYNISLFNKVPTSVDGINYNWENAFNINEVKINKINNFGSTTEEYANFSFTEIASECDSEPFTNYELKIEGLEPNNTYQFELELTYSYILDLFPHYNTSIDNKQTLTYTLPSFSSGRVSGIPSINLPKSSFELKKTYDGLIAHVDLYYELVINLATITAKDGFEAIDNIDLKMDLISDDYLSEYGLYYFQTYNKYEEKNYTDTDIVDTDGDGEIVIKGTFEDVAPNSEYNFTIDITSLDETTTYGINYYIPVISYVNPNYAKFQIQAYSDENVYLNYLVSSEENEFNRNPDGILVNVINEYDGSSNKIQIKSMKNDQYNVSYNSVNLSKYIDFKYNTLYDVEIAEWLWFDDEGLVEHSFDASGNALGFDGEFHLTNEGYGGGDSVNGGHFPWIWLTLTIILFIIISICIGIIVVMKVNKD